MRAVRVDGLFNVRATRGQMPWVIRSGAPEGLGPTGAAHLRDLGVTVILDLRERTETGVRGHTLPIRSVPLYGEQPPVTGRLEAIYEALLRQRGQALAEAVGVVADASGAVLVHCTAGKDRTGLVVALARLAAGEPADAVVEDYALSGPLVYEARADHAHRLAEGRTEAERAEIMRLHLDSPPEAIRHALAVIDELGGVTAYLLANGLTAGQVAALRRKNAGVQ